ncbi:MAG: HAD-IIIA family hydrolase [Planctomycetes bacterium]|nr:HAD-IIIA family hydrolase [Planctomycetota bacterium]
MSQPAVFLDRDGTIIDDVGYLNDPEKVRLLPGAADAIRRMRSAGYRVVIISNQSGIARGMLDEPTLAQIQARLEELLDQDGASLDGVYYCPYLDGPDAVVEAYRRNSELRKPRPGMLFQAARELNLDLKRSWMIGDSTSDVAAGHRAGCRTILVRSNRADSAEDERSATCTVDNLAEAADAVLRMMTRNQQNPPAKLDATAPEEQAHQDQVLRALDRIHDQLERTDRRNRQADFSVLRLFGALLQMFALVAALWGVAALLNEQSAPATARLMLACFLQLASITALAVDRFR